MSRKLFTKLSIGDTVTKTCSGCGVTEDLTCRKLYKNGNGFKGRWFDSLGYAWENSRCRTCYNEWWNNKYSTPRSKSSAAHVRKGFTNEFLVAEALRMEGYQVVQTKMFGPDLLVYRGNRLHYKVEVKSVYERIRKSGKKVYYCSSFTKKQKVESNFFAFIVNNKIFLVPPDKVTSRNVTDLYTCLTGET